MLNVMWKIVRLFGVLYLVALYVIFLNPNLCKKDDNVKGLLFCKEVPFIEPLTGDKDERKIFNFRYWDVLRQLDP